MTAKEKLEEYGFIEVGDWHKTNSIKTKINYHLDENAKNQEDLNYAFVEGDKVFYIGVTTNTLLQRMNGYKNAKASEKDKYGKVEASTNKKVYQHILKRLNNKKKILIYALPELNLGDYEGLRISPVSGIEHSLIREFDNGELLNNRAVKPEKIKKVKSNFISEDGKEFEMELRKEYYHKGKIGFKKKSSQLLPNETGVLMNIHIINEMILTGTFTRSGDTLTVNGKKPLATWYQNNFKLNDKVLVTIKDKNNLELNKVNRN